MSEIDGILENGYVIRGTLDRTNNTFHVYKDHGNTNVYAVKFIEGELDCVVLGPYIRTDFTS